MAIARAYQDYRDLVAWQKAMDLVEGVYRTSKGWPRDEVYGLSNQVRRAAVSVPSNIAEGQGRATVAEFLRFLSMAHGSLREAETQLVIARRLGYLDEATGQSLQAQAAEVGRLLQGLMRRLRANSESLAHQPDN